MGRVGASWAGHIRGKHAPSRRLDRVRFHGSGEARPTRRVGAVIPVSGAFRPIGVPTGLETVEIAPKWNIFIWRVGLCFVVFFLKNTHFGLGGRF